MTGLPFGCAAQARQSLGTLARKGSMIVLLATLAACGTTSHYQAPALSTPASLGHPANGVAGANIAWATWWQALQDPVLDRLLLEATQNNQDLALAAARIAEARANVLISESANYPVLDVNGTASKIRTSQNAGKLAAGANPVSKDVQLGLAASYEIDFWGKHRQADQAARARLAASEYNRGVVQITLVADVVQRYLALRSYDAQVMLAQAVLATRQENLRLQEKRLGAGAASALETNQAKAELAISQGNLSELQKQVANSEVVLAQLLGRTPEAIANPVIARGASIEQLLAHMPVPADLPADLLTRRPDIASAGQNLIAAHADIEQARTQYFPSIKLSTSLGKEARGLQDLFSPASLFWNLGTSLSQPLFRAGAIDAAVTGADARQKQALVQYVQTVQVAFRDAHDALSNWNASSQLQATLQQRLMVQQESTRLAQLRLAQGYSSAIDSHNAERDLLQLQSSKLDSERGQLLALVALYKALGGGWQRPL